LKQARGPNPSSLLLIFDLSPHMPAPSHGYATGTHWIQGWAPQLVWMWWWK